VVSGCTKIPYIVLFNNSGHTLTIDSEGETYTVSPDAIVKIAYPGNTELLNIESVPNIKWQYKVEYPDKTYMNGNTFNVQIEADGIIYVLPPNTQNFVKVLPTQPPNFPWKLIF
jgi:hypothetical protein